MKEPEKMATIERLLDRAAEFDNKARLAVWVIVEAGLDAPPWLVELAEEAEPEPEQRENQCGTCPFRQEHIRASLVRTIGQCSTSPEKWGCHNGGRCKGMADAVKGSKR